VDLGAPRTTCRASSTTFPLPSLPLDCVETFDQPSHTYSLGLGFVWLLAQTYPSVITVDDLERARKLVIVVGIIGTIGHDAFEQYINEVMSLAVPEYVQQLIVT
jgi:hypothetical protein